MSNSNQQGGQTRPVGYPDPTSYPSPTAQYYPPPPPNNQQTSEPYRASPTGSNGSLPLPSMRPLDPIQQQQQQEQQRQQQQQMAGNLPPPVAQMGGPYYHNAGQGLPHPSYANVTSDPNGQQNMRYALPLSDSRVMSGGRHKKEIKRRTKTGCLTCRKRRIKCDEAHPQCRNCQKSKRECLGYDPIFKQQPGPAAIQPAPSSAPSQGGTPASINPYGHQPHMLGGYGGVANMSYDPALSGNSQSPGSQQYEYQNAIDPALEAAAPAVVLYAQPAKRIIADLLAQGGEPPEPLPENIEAQPHQIEEIKHLFYSLYAPGLENFIESKWYAMKGVHKLITDKVLLDQWAVYLHHLANTKGDNPESMRYTQSVEARLVWGLASMVHGENLKSTNALVPAQDDPTEAAHRLNVYETLLSGAVASSNALTQPVPGSTDHHRLRELEFWFTLGNFVCLPYESTEEKAAQAIDETLSALRNLLDGRENRDVLYSIAVVRVLGQRVSEYTETDAPLHLDETDNKSKLSVAKKFVADEGSGAGTTNVIRRLCELATRSWAPAPVKEE